MAVPHYMYLVLKMPRPNGIITVKGSFKLSDLCDTEFHKLAQNFGMIANYGEPKGNVPSATTSVTKQLEENPGSQRRRNYGYNHRTQRKLQEKKKRLRQHRQQAYKSRVDKIRLLSHELS
jgi:hypothetical protein